VTFEIDANGILHVSARDQSTGAEQSITISGTGNLDSAEVDRMVADAEQYRSEDAEIREHVDARNELDSAAYQVERRMSELQLATHIKARAENQVEEARQALKDDAPTDRLRVLANELQQVYHSLQAEPSGEAAGGNGSGNGSPSEGNGAPASSDEDDVIDADFTVS
jgi:molecular chaperone DnaK